MKNNDELMISAKEALRGKWGLAVLGYIVIILINIPIQIVAEYSKFSIIISVILGGPIALGTSIFHLNISRNNKPKIDDLFEGFRDAMTPIVTFILMVTQIFLWALLLIIPGIIVAISFSMTFFIMADNPSLKPIEALNQSREMMNGHKMQYAGIVLRIIALALLCILTLGIGFLFLIPYSKVLNAKFYEEISG
jgi:uncharacterized membrane protein